MDHLLSLFLKFSVLNLVYFEDGKLIKLLDGFKAQEPHSFIKVIVCKALGYLQDFSPLCLANHF
jgi:hypothetical protein